jgi:hypothetical protein
MKQTLTTHDAAQQLHHDKDGGWTWNGAQALVEYLEELEADMGTEIEFDRVSLRCDFSEHRSLYKWADDYFCGDSWMDACGLDKDEDHEDEEIDNAIRNYIYDNGTLIEFDGGIIVSSF